MTFEHEPARGLAAWLRPDDYAALREARSAGRPFARAGLASAWSAQFGWDLLERVLRVSDDTLVVRRGQLLELPAPPDLTALRTLFASGAGVVSRRAERRARALARLAGLFAAEFREQAHIQLFATPAGTHGFGWHYDIEDVLILQTAGVKTYYFRENTQNPALAPGLSLDFGAIAAETSPLRACSLAAGDALYLPRGTWHVAKATDDSLSLSLGLR